MIPLKSISFDLSLYDVRENIYMTMDCNNDFIFYPVNVLGHFSSLIRMQVPSVLVLFTLIFILSVNIHRRAEKQNCGIYPGGFVCAPCTK